MALPGIKSTTILDGSLGIVNQNPTGIQVKMGNCSSGNVNQLYSFSNIQDAKTSLGYGKLLDAISATLDVSGGSVYAMKLAASTAGSIGTVIASLVTSPTASDGVLIVTGTPTNDYQIVVTISRAGKVGTSPYPAFQYSIDNGLTFTDSLIIPAGGAYTATETGLTFTFSNGVNGLMLNDSWKFPTTASTFNNTDVANGMITLLADDRTWEAVHLVGVCDTTIATTVASYMNTAATNERYVHAFVEARDMDMQAVLESATNTFPMTFVGGETLKIQISNDFGQTYQITKTFTFVAGAYAAISNLVTALNVQSFTGGLFTVQASGNKLQIVTQSIKGKTVLKVDGTSTAIGGALIQYTGSQTASGETEDAWMNSLISTWVAFVSDRVSVCAGSADIYSQANRDYNIRNCAHIVSARESLIPLREDLGKVARGALPLVLIPSSSSGKYGIYHNEDVKPGLDVSRFTTLRKFKNISGFYITNGRTFASPGSDFTYLQYRRVIDRAATLLTAVNKNIIEYRFRVNKDGTIFEIDARNVEVQVTDYLMANLKSNIVGLVVQVDRGINLLQSQTLKITASILPYGYAKYIELVFKLTPVTVV